MRRRAAGSLAEVDHGTFLRALPPGDLWVFGYGSLMWHPGFPFSAEMPGLLYGYHRELCLLSLRLRGTPRRPGLVMGLEHGGACSGRLFRVARRRAAGVLEALWQREMPDRAYLPRLVTVRPARGGARTVRALAFVADADHPQYVGRLELAQRARLVAQGVGRRGRCIDYVRQTVEHMRALGVRDLHLERVLSAASRRRA